MSHRNACVLLVILLPGTPATTAAREPDWPIVRSGRLERSGLPYRAIGVNAFNLFSRTLSDPSDTTYRASLHELSTNGIPFARFMACGFWPNDALLYRDDPAEHFKRLDEVVRAAESEGVGLVPSLFWNLATVSDLVGEPIDQLGNPESRTIAFIRKYTREVVDRYHHSPAIWGWEFGNEYNLAADLPNAAQHRPPAWPSLGTPASRSERDELRSEQLVIALREFAGSVRAIDPDRLISSGNAAPRPSAWHNSHERSWTADSPDQFRQVILRDHPDPINCLSVHAYPGAKGRLAAGSSDLNELLGLMSRVARESRKPIFVGEFGVPAGEDATADRASFESLLSAIEGQGIDLAALWVYDFQSQEGEWNTTFHNARRWMLAELAESNRRLRVLAATPSN